MARDLMDAGQDLELAQRAAPRVPRRVAPSRAVIGPRPLPTQEQLRRKIERLFPVTEPLRG
jgi:hypothetical protein